MKKRTTGLHPYRFKENPEERNLARAWDKIGEDLLAYLLDDRPVQGGRSPKPSDRDYLVAATVIQWLGSPVGASFLDGLGYNKKNVSADDVNWIAGFCVGLAEMHRRLIGGSDSAGVRECARNAGITLAAAKKAGVAPFDLKELKKAGVK